MNVFGICQVHAPDPALTSQVRELTVAELEEVSGGVLPLVVIGGAILIAAVMQESGEDSSTESEDPPPDESDA